MNQRDQEAEHIESAERWSIGERRNTEKAGESKTDVGSQDPSGPGGRSLGASGLWWRLPGQANGILVQEISLKSPLDLRRKVSGITE